MSTSQNYELPESTGESEETGYQFDWDGYLTEEHKMYDDRYAPTFGPDFIVPIKVRRSLVQLSKTLSVLGLSRAEEVEIAEELLTLASGKCPTNPGSWLTRRGGVDE